MNYYQACINSGLCAAVDTTTGFVNWELRAGWTSNGMVMEFCRGASDASQGSHVCLGWVLIEQLQIEQRASGVVCEGGDVQCRALEMEQ